MSDKFQSVVCTTDINWLNTLSREGWEIKSVNAIVIPYEKQHGKYNPTPSATVKYIALLEKQLED